MGMFHERKLDAKQSPLILQMVSDSKTYHISIQVLYLVSISQWMIFIPFGVGMKLGTCGFSLIVSERALASEFWSILLEIRGDFELRCLVLSCLENILL